MSKATTILGALLVALTLGGGVYIIAGTEERTARDVDRAHHAAQRWLVAHHTIGTVTCHDGGLVPACDVMTEGRPPFRLNCGATECWLATEAQ